MDAQSTTTGLLHAFLFDGKGGGKVMGWQEIGEWKPEDGLLWVHLSYAGSETEQWLYDSSGLDQVVVEALTSEGTRPRATAIGKGLLLNLRGVNLNPGSQEEDMVSIRMWAEEHRIISTRKRQLLSIQQVTENILAGNGPESTGEFLNSFIELLTDYIDDTIDALEDNQEQLEEQIAQNHHQGLRSEISVIRRKATQLRRYLAPQREALTRIQSEHPAWFSERDKRYLHETTNQLTRIVEDIDSIRDRALIAQEEILNLLSQDLNNRMYILSLITAIFLPLTFITGLLGINVAGIPGAASPYGFILVVILLLLVSVGQVLYFKHKGWLQNR